MEIIGGVWSTHIDDMNTFIENHSIQAFRSAVWHGAFLEHSMEYIHPAEELEKTKNFSIIQSAFINAVC